MTQTLEAPKISQVVREDHDSPLYVGSTTGRWPESPLAYLCRAQRSAEESRRGFHAAVAWALRQDFEPDHADRVRRSAWSREPSE